MPQTVQMQLETSASRMEKAFLLTFKCSIELHIFNNNDELQIWFENWFALEDASFYRTGIGEILEWWEEVINNDGEYVRVYVRS